jgi:hypothetical protein
MLYFTLEAPYNAKFTCSDTIIKFSKVFAKEKQKPYKSNTKQDTIHFIA